MAGGTKHDVFAEMAMRWFERTNTWYEFVEWFMKHVEPDEKQEWLEWLGADEGN